MACLPEKINWPPHREIPIGERKMDWSRYRPKVAEAMRAQGMTTFGHLQDRIKFMLRDAKLRDRFNLEGVSQGSIQSFLTTSESWANSPFHVDGQGFKKMPLAIAFALEVDPVDLFGDPKVPENLIAKSERLREHYVCDWSKYRPEVVKAMQAVGMTQLKHLVDQAYELYQNMHPNRSYESFYTAVSAAVSSNNKASHRYVFIKNDGYSDLVLCVAAVLKMSPEKLFRYPPHKERDTALEYVLADDFESIACPSHEAEYDLKESLDLVLSTIDERRRKVLEMRLGLKDGKVHTLEEIAQVLGVIRQRVSQLEQDALKKLWDKADLRPLIDCCEKPSQANEPPFTTLSP